MNHEIHSKRMQIYHRRQQVLAATRLEAAVGTISKCMLLSPESSLTLKRKVEDAMSQARVASQVQRHRFTTVDEALAWLERSGLWTMGPIKLWALEFVLVGLGPSGYFRGLPSVSTLRAGLVSAVESVVFHLEGHTALYVLDLAFDDPVDGDFVEVEVVPLGTGHCASQMNAPVLNGGGGRTLPHTGHLRALPHP